MEPVTAQELELVAGGATWTIRLSCPTGYRLYSYVSGSSRCYTCRFTGGFSSFGQGLGGTTGGGTTGGGAENGGAEGGGATGV
jgi:hypothetical protein